MVSVGLILDTTPPPAASLSVVGSDGGVVTTTADQVVLASLTSVLTPEQVAGEAKVWGDVDPAGIGTIQATEQASTWFTYASPVIPVRLSAGAGVKVLHARLRDGVHNETPEVLAQVVYDPSYPVVSILSGPDRTRVSRQPGYSTCSFVWATQVDVVGYQVRVVASAGSSVSSGAPVGTAAGSSGVAGNSPVPAGTTVTTTVDATDLQAASPGDGAKTVKVFVCDGTGRWSL